LNNLTCKHVPRLDGASAAELGRLFPEPSSAAPLLSLLQESGIDGFNLRSIVVLKDNHPILLMPLFETRFDLSDFVEGWIKRSLKVAGRLIPSLFQPRVLGVGFMLGEWNEIGIDPQIDEDTLESAFKMAFDALHALAVELKSDIVALCNVSHCGGHLGEALNQFNRVKCPSFARMPIDFNSLDEFLARLSRAARKDLRRKMRVAPEVQIIRSRDISPFLDRIYSLYLETVKRSSLAFGMHNRLFFEKICERVPGAEYTLYFVREELAAFNLLVVKQEAMVDKHFCMNYELGRKYNLYVLSWLENLRACVERGIPFYHAGQGAEKTKAHLGATLIPIYLLFKHRRPVIDRFLVAWPAINEKVLSHLGFRPAVSPRRLGCASPGPTGEHPCSPP
jgi:hypothetical protein